MNDEKQAALVVAAPKQQSQSEILGEIRNDRELIARLRITPQELEALSKCALLGTLTNKQDMLFLLRVIRDATDPAAERSDLASQLVDQPEDFNDPDPDFSRVRLRLTPARTSAPDSPEVSVRRRVIGLFGILFLTIAMVGGFVWGGLHALWHLRDSFVATAGAPSQPWYERLDHFNILLSSEIFFLASAAITIYLKSWNRGRRLKVRPERPALW